MYICLDDKTTCKYTEHLQSCLLQGVASVNETLNIGVSPFGKENHLNKIMNSA